MKNSLYTFPPTNKYICRSTGEEVEMIAFNAPKVGMRSVDAWVTYIDSNGKEHIKEHLNIPLDFKPITDEVIHKLTSIVNPNFQV